jgi:hypothetical protein
MFKKQYTPGELAYIEDCMNQPRYPNGTMRVTWEQLPGFAKASWEKTPTPRDIRPNPSYG